MVTVVVRGSLVATGQSDTGLDRQLASLGRNLERQRAAGAGSAVDDQLEVVARLRNDLLAYGVTRESGGLAVIRNAVESLRGMCAGEVVKTVPAVLCRDFGFERAMVSRVCEQEWTPRSVHARGVNSSKPQSFHGFSLGAPVQLASSPAEAKLIRTQRGIVQYAEGQGHQGYLAAPIIVDGTVIGILHAELSDTGATTARQLALLEAFGECLAVVYEHCILEEKAVLQQHAVEKLCTTVDQLLVQTNPVVTAVPSVPEPVQSCINRNEREQPPSPGLTAREREVMSYVAIGATNRDIARCLLISEGTVKSHLKRIARKFNTTNRAAALAMYMGVGIREL